MWFAQHSEPQLIVGNLGNLKQSFLCEVLDTGRAPGVSTALLVLLSQAGPAGLLTLCRDEVQSLFRAELPHHQPAMVYTQRVTDCYFCKIGQK